MPLKGSTKYRREMKVREATPCYHCGKSIGRHEFGSVLLVVEFQDGSYSGVFDIDLCLDCLTAPHNAEPNRRRRTWMRYEDHDGERCLALHVHP